MGFLNPWVLVGLLLFYGASVGVVGYKAYRIGQQYELAKSLKAENERLTAKLDATEQILAEWQVQEQREDAEDDATERKLDETRKLLDEARTRSCIWSDDDERRLRGEGNRPQ